MLFDVLKTIPQYLIPKGILTSFAGSLAASQCSWFKNYCIQHFIEHYQVNMSEALIEDPRAYSSFNDFFIRHLKPDSRPLASADILSPVDGCISEIGCIEQGQLLQAKGKQYSVAELLACDNATAQQFVHGRFATLYLSPKDYHRVHMPIEARLRSMNYIPGALFSVQPTTARVVPKLFARNERLAIFFDTPVGLMAMVMVGATIVGSMSTSWSGTLKRGSKRRTFNYMQAPSALTFKQGDEMGYFQLGSTVVLLFADGQKMQWQDSLSAGSIIRFGQSLGDIT